MIRFILLLFLFCEPLLASSPRVSHDVSALTGKVCSGPYLAHSKTKYHLEIKVGEQPKTYFEKWQLAAENLDINKTHLVIIYDKNTPIASWKLNFLNLKTNFVIVWKAGKSWKMKAISSGICGL